MTPARIRPLALGALAVCLAGCGTGPSRAPAIGEAFAGPATLQLRDELAARAKVTATVNHGERLELLSRRRRFVRVRTAAGAEGWCDSRQLLSPADMRQLAELAARLAAAPSLGEATVFETMNVHTVPNRQSPSFVQVQPNARVAVLGRFLAPRVPYTPPEPPETRRAPAPPPPRRKAAPTIPPPPPPPAPRVPDNWMELSGNPEPAPPAAAPAPPAAAPRIDDWTLIRTREGKAGWVLTNMLLMAIPDEVAQYAERARITAYFRLPGPVNKAGEEKPTWLWTTLQRTGVEHDFDSIRVFAWNTRRQRYETAYIERGLTGYRPVTVKQVSGAPMPSFILLAEDKEGKVWQREYGFVGVRVRLLHKEPAARPAPLFTAAPAPPRPDGGDEAETARPGWRERVKGWWDRLRGRKTS